MKESAIEKELLKMLPPERVKTRYIDRVSYGADAGFYFLLPKAVVKPMNEEEIQLLFNFLFAGATFFIFAIILRNVKFIVRHYIL